MPRMPRLTATQLRAVLTVTGNADAVETFASDEEYADEVGTQMNHFEAGLDKLYDMLLELEAREKRRALG